MELSNNFSTQRLQFCIILIAIVHMLIIFGIRWQDSFVDKSDTSRAVEVILAASPSIKAPENTRFIAAQAQLASGPKEKQYAEQYQNNTWQPSAQLKNTAPINQVISTTNTKHITKLNSDTAIITDANMQSTPQEALEQRLENLRVELTRHQEQYNQQPKKRTITAAAHAAADAEYLYQWRAKIEQVGNLNYPAEAKKRKLHGEVLLLVAINADGSLHEVNIRQSSGSKILDEAALRIVRLAAPFQPLPPEIRKDTDVLEIIRTWQFGKNYKWYAT